MKKFLILALLLYDVLGANRREILDYHNRDINDNGRQKVVYADGDKQSRKKHLFDPYEVRRIRDDTKESIEKKVVSGRRKYKPYSFEELDSHGLPPRSVEYAPDETRKQESEPSSEREPEKKSFRWDCDREHEKYESCFAGCASITCDNPRDRLRPCYPFCEPGCICEPPYVRDDRTHKCVLPDDCTKGLKGIPNLSQVDEIPI